MSAEIKSKGKKVETVLSLSSHKKLKAHCKKEGVSISQHVRDLIQKDLKH